MGIADPGLDPGERGHRLLGLRLEVGGLEPLVMVSAYFQAGVGMNELNRTLLSKLAQWQEQLQLPVLAGGTFNVPPHAIGRADFCARSGFVLTAPSEPTYRTYRSSRASTRIDYFVVTKCLGERIAVPTVLVDFPLRPHSLVCCIFLLELRTRF